jgi:hypothetical protein
MPHCCPHCGYEKPFTFLGSFHCRENSPPKAEVWPGSVTEFDLAAWYESQGEQWL